jgi:hypothetical protein
MVSKEGDHERGSYFLKTGYRPDPTLHHPSLGAVLVNQIPNASLVIPQHIAIGNAQWPPRGGFLGDQLDAFRVYDPGRDVPNLKSQVETERQTRRVNNLEVVSKAFERGRHLQVEKTLHQHIFRSAPGVSDRRRDPSAARCLRRQHVRARLPRGAAVGGGRYSRG